MRCDSAMRRLDAFRTAELPPREQSEVTAHLASCAACRASLQNLKALASTIRSIEPPAPSNGRTSLQSLTDSFDVLEVPEGTILVAFSANGLRLIRRGSLADLRSLYQKRYGRSLERAPLPAALRRQVLAALRGEGVLKATLDVNQSTDLEQRVLFTLHRIPRGEVRTYSWLAQQVGRPKAVRAVGNIVARNAVPYVVPCHRVVPATGGVGNYIFGSQAKRELLQREGVDVAGLDALSRKHIRFIGSRTTHIYCVPTCRDARRIRDENQVPFHGAVEAAEQGFRRCKRCEP